MTVHLRAVRDDEFDEWLDERKAEYIADRVRAGEDATHADETSQMQFATLFPGNRPAPGQLAFRVVEEERAVGYLWIGPRAPDAPETYWVFDVSMEEAERGKGYGRAAMLLAEEEARKAGAKSLGLNVFGHNKVARHLYESLGYDTMAVQMMKDL